MARRNRFLAVVGLTIVIAAALGYRYRDSFIHRSAPQATGRGTVFYDRWRATDGYTLVEGVIEHGPHRCAVLDIYGFPVLILPDSTFCEPLQDGGLLAIQIEKFAVFDKNLKPRWSVPGFYHHDLLYDNERKEFWLWSKHPPRTVDGYDPVVIETLNAYNDDGKLIYAWDAYKNQNEIKNVTGKLTWQQQDGFWEYSHFNSVQILPKNPHYPGDPRFRPGNLLISNALDDFLAIIDRETQKIVWSFHQPGFKDVHAARMLPNGHILYFLNSMNGQDLQNGIWFSEVVELDPLTNQRTWFYRSPINRTFHAVRHGFAQLLPNGNILVTNLANGGGAFEVTRDGRVVWDWENSEDQPILQMEVYRVRRVSRQWVEGLIQAAKALPELERRAYFNF